MGNYTGELCYGRLCNYYKRPLYCVGMGDQLVGGFSRRQIIQNKLKNGMLSVEKHPVLSALIYSFQMIQE